MLLKKPNQENIENYHIIEVIFIDFYNSLSVQVTR